MGVRASSILGSTPLLSPAASEESLDDEEEDLAVETEEQSIATGAYAAGKWGRFVRAPDFYFEVMREFGPRLVPLGELVLIRFGVKTGCDAFFMPHDITAEALERFESSREFRKQYGVDRLAVEDGRLKIVKAGDGSAHPIESKFLKPEVHSLMKVNRPIVRPEDFDRVVLLIAKPLSKLEGTYISKYLKYGETHTFASKKSKPVPVPKRSTVQARNPWYNLTGLVNPGFAFWPMAQQYRHIIAENPDSLICNHNLFDLINRDLSLAEIGALVAILNSTLVGLFKNFLRTIRWN